MARTYRRLFDDTTHYAWFVVVVVPLTLGLLLLAGLMAATGVSPDGADQ